MTTKSIVKKILDKKFDSVINGYSPSSVDSFLDIIIEEIKQIDTELESFKTKNEQMEEQFKKLKQTNVELEKKINMQESEIKSLRKELKITSEINNEIIEEFSDE